MNLKPFVDRTVVVQFKQLWLLVEVAEGRLEPWRIKDPDSPADGPPRTTMVPCPFVRGKLVERDGQFIVQYMSGLEGNENVKLELIISEDVIHSVTSISEDRIIAP